MVTELTDPFKKLSIVGVLVIGLEMVNSSNPVLNDTIVADVSGIFLAVLRSQLLYADPWYGVVLS